ncbi:hypothetical protein K2173_012170 [Erythroxylum novogranatense]|uniref:Phosphatidylinositol N-acetylglucosaminyltransferase subunit H conserved domain-containing protein n=1 Tax=Erythroxylum novogranatense TaxID=1862640 RepID=A0AAV8SR98_9ROSI|nr:hypothetical protein K2173_012170 [Erythroxylum novogranatense]
MVEFQIVDKRYIYLHDHKYPCQSFDVHHVVVRKSNLKGFLLHFFVLILVTNAFYLILFNKGGSIIIFFWSFLLGATLVKVMIWRSIVKESMLIMPSFGVQLQTHYRSGRTVHRFIPISKILKPVLVECVTPVTCFWSLSLILCGEEDQILVFKKLRPPLKILVPVWKALRAATDREERAWEIVCQRKNSMPSLSFSSALYTIKAPT